MSSLLKANSISAATGSTVTIPSGTTLDIASGATIDATGATATGFGVSNTGTIVRRNTDQSLTKNAITKVQFDTAVLNPNSWFDVSTNHRFQPDESGNYLFIANQGSNEVSTFIVDPDTGRIAPTGASAEVLKPACIKFLQS